MRNREIEHKIKGAVERITPDVWEDILSRCDGQQAARVYKPIYKRKRWVRALSAVAAALVLTFAGVIAARQISYSRVTALVMLDVNPSLELRVNNDNRVIEAIANNQDAITVLDNMDLRNTPVDVAVNALIGSMLKYGFIRENANSVLLTVSGTDGEKSVVLQRELTESISLQLNMVNGAIISQSLPGDETIQGLADEHMITYGKAALIQKIIAQNRHLLFADLARLSINQLNLLLSAKGVSAEGMETEGSPSDTDYIGEARAKQAALSAANLLESDVSALHAELDCDDGMMVYDVEFYYNGLEYEYEVSAMDGTIMGQDREAIDDDAPPPAQGVAAPSGAPIGEARAIQIVEGHSGITAYTGLEIELDKDDGMYVYDVEFDYRGEEYSYEINAITGEIMSWEMDD